MMKRILSLLVALFMPFMASADVVLNILSESDAKLYTQIFDLQDQEKITSAQKLQSQITDDVLLNEVLYQRYFSKTYRTRGQEVVNWMAKYNDTPGAVRMKKLAAKKQISVKKPNLPNSITGTDAIETPQSENWTAKKYTGNTAKKIDSFKRAIRTGSTKTARTILEERAFKSKLTESDYGRLAGRLAYIYYTNGEMELAKKWGFASSDASSEYGLWTMGLIYFKEENFKESQKYFSKILELKHINNARKIEAAFWAGRAAELNGAHDMARSYWAVAASYPMAFYGALAATMLGIVPQYEFFEQDCTDEDVQELLQTKYGKRALALLQIGRKDRAEEYLKLLITSRATNRQLHAVNSVATEYGLPRVSVQIAGVLKDRSVLEIDDDIIYSAQYPLPDWEPMGGWSIDRALLFAITKQESGFRVSAKSGAGANGLMQLMPNTAKRIARDNNMDYSQMDMSNPEHNMFLGQQYIVDLLSHPSIENNIIKMLAAYNAGMGTLAKFEKSFYTYDPLLYIESFPAYETRSYIKRVMSNLWLYRARLGQPLTSLKELSNANWPLYNSEDAYVQQQIADRMMI